MNLKSKKVLIPSLVAAAVLAAGGTALAMNLTSDRLSDSDREKATSVALAAVGGGKVLGAERNDDQDVSEGEGRFEVSVLKSDGTEVEVTLDDNFAVVGNPDVDDDTVPSTQNSTSPSTAPATDDTDDNLDDNADDNLDNNGDDFSDDRQLTRAEINKATAAALKRFPGARITDIDDNDNNDVLVGYDVDLVAKNGVEWNLELNKAFKITQVERED